jgi:hypothetical protein
MNAVHPYSDAQALVYSPQYTDPTHHHRPSFHPSMSASPWSSPAHALMSTSQPDHARMYSLMHQPIHNMPYSAPSTGLFYNHHHHPHNNPQQQPRMQLSTPVPLNFTSPQIESSIGPHRGILTRRQARTAQLRGTPQPPTGQHEGTESTSPSETQDVRVFLFSWYFSAYPFIRRYPLPPNLRRRVHRRPLTACLQGNLQNTLTRPSLRIRTLSRCRRRLLYIPLPRFLPTLIPSHSSLARASALALSLPHTALPQPLPVSLKGLA